jgi:hypothetical protein
VAFALFWSFNCIFPLLLSDYLNATFNNISAMSLQSVLFVDETGVPAENLNIR